MGPSYKSNIQIHTKNSVVIELMPHLNATLEKLPPEGDVYWVIN